MYLLLQQLLFSIADFAIEDDFGKNRIQSYSEMRVFDVCE